MHIPVRFRIIAAFAVTAFACHYSPAQTAEPMTPAQIAEWAKSLPPGTQIEFEHVTTNEQAKGEGASLDASGDKSNTDIDASAPSAALSGGAKSSGGSAKGGSKAEQFQFNWLPILTWLAAAVAGVFAFLAFQRGQPKQALSLGVVAGGLAAVAFFPPLIVFGFVGAAVWLAVQSGVLSKVVASTQDEIHSALQDASHYGGLANQNREALRAVAAGVSDLKDVDPVAYAKVTELISRHADENDKATIKTVRRADDLN